MHARTRACMTNTLLSDKILVLLVVRVKVRLIVRIDNGTVHGMHQIMRCVSISFDSTLHRNNDDAFAITVRNIVNRIGAAATSTRNMQ